MTTVRQSAATDTTAVNGQHQHGLGHHKVGSNGVDNGTFGIGNGGHHGVTGTNGNSGLNTGAGGYDRYATSQGYQVPAANERAEMAGEIPASDYARNY